MTRARFLAFLVFALTAVSVASGQQKPTFRAGTDAVTVEVSVRDRSRPVTGLQAEDFIVMDNGVEQTVAAVSYGVKPIDVTVVLDVSLSVSGTMLQRLGRAVRQLIVDRGTGDRFKLIMFNNRISRIVDFTTDAEVVERAILGAQGAGGSAIWDALSVAAVRHSSAESRRRRAPKVMASGSDWPYELPGLKSVASAGASPASIMRRAGTSRSWRR